MKGILRIFFVLVLVCASSAALVPTQAAAEDEPVTYTAGVLVFPTTNNPFIAGIGEADASHIGIMYEPLVHYTSYAQVVPLLAASWSYNGATTTWTFNLDPDAKWSDGVPVTAVDVQFSYEKMWELDPYRGYDANELVESITVIGSKAVEFALTEPQGGFLALLTEIVIVPQHVWGTMTNEEILAYANDDPVGSGAWVAREMVADSHVIYDARPDYWGGAPDIDVFVKKFYSTTELQAQALINGDIDAVARLNDTTVVPSLLEQDDIELYQVDDNSTMTFMVNHRHEPWNLTEVRNAVSIGIDRGAQIDYAVDGWGILPNNIEVSPNLAHANPGVGWAYAGYTQEERIAMANTALDSIAGMSTIAGGVGGVRTYNGELLTFELMCTTWIEHVTAAELLEADLADMGIDMTVNPVSARDLVTIVFRQKSDATLANWETTLWGRPFATQYDYVASQWGYYDEFAPSKRSYIVGWSSAEGIAIGEDLNALQALPWGDPTRDALIQSTQLEMAEELPAMPLYCKTAPNAYRTDRLAGWAEDSGMLLYGAVPAMISPINLLSLHIPEQTISPRALKLGAVEALEEIAEGANPRAQRYINRAIRYINKSLDDNLWEDESNLNPCKGWRVFTYEKAAVRKLERAKCKDNSIAGAIDEVIASLIQADDALATLAIEEAMAGEVQNPRYQRCYDWLIAKAQCKLEKAQQLAEEGKSARAIRYYGKAWRYAQWAAKLAPIPETSPNDDLPPGDEF